MGFSLLGEELHKKLQANRSLKKQLEAVDVLEAAENALKELFGTKEALHARPLFLKNRTLTISCTSSIIAQEIRLHQKEVVEKINALLGEDSVDRIRYLA